MKAMILAAGRGLRMGELTAHTAKPLLTVKGKALIQWHVEKLVAAGITDLVINHAWHGEQIQTLLGNGKRLGATIQYSAENPALETAGGIANARHLLNTNVFAVISADIMSAYDYTRLHSIADLVLQLGHSCGIQGYCVMVPNPDFNHQGDFDFQTGCLHIKNQQLTSDTFTFGNIAVYHDSLFSTIGQNQFAKLGDSLRQAVPHGRIIGEVFRGDWHNIGTAEQLEQVNQRFK